MTVMGLPSWLHWLAWFIKQFSFIFISVILMVILFKVIYYNYNPYISFYYHSLKFFMTVIKCYLHVAIFKRFFIINF